ncbi:MAG: FAD-binding oxidoreductase [Woeseia sp.]
MAVDTRSSSGERVLDVDGASLWSRSSNRFSGTQVLDSEESADVAIVGGGLTGLSTALHLREKGYECVVIEAGKPGDGATGRAGGLVAPDFVIDTVASISQRFGPRQGERFARLVGSSAKTTFDLIAEYRIDCQHQQQGFVVPAASKSATRSLDDRGKQWRSLGFPVTTLDEKGTHASIGTSLYRTALYFEQGGALNPLAYATGLAETVSGMGARVFVNSPVNELRRVGRRWRVLTNGGSVDAERVVLAANDGNLKLHPALQNTAVPMLVYEYATRVLTTEEVRHNMGSALPYTDRQPYLFTARLDSESRLISALPGLLTARRAGAILSEASSRLGRFYPGLDSPSVECIWQGVAYLNADLLPAIYAPEGTLDLLAVQACNGRGIALNTAVGREIASVFESDNEDTSSIPITRPKKIRYYKLAKRTPAMLMTIARIGDRFSKAWTRDDIVNR